jgi:hypothetical protein
MTEEQPDDFGEFTIFGGAWLVRAGGVSWWSVLWRGLVGASSPFARLTVDRDQITITSVFGTFLVTRENLVLITPIYGLRSIGVQFTVNDDINAVVFWSSDIDTVMDHLWLRGWEVTEPV